MEGDVPFLSAGLPGLTFGMSLGRGLSIQLDPSEEVRTSDDNNYIEEDECLHKNSLVPNAMLVIHFHAIHDLIAPSFDSCNEKIIYVSFTVGSIKKATLQKVYNPKNDSILVFNEVKYFPIVVNPKVGETMNKLIILVFACKAGEQHAVTMSKHKLIGRYEINIHKLLRVVACKENVSLLNKKGNVIGQLELEFGILYGCFGYGQSYQVKTSSHTPEELVKMCMFPRIPPVKETDFRGTAVLPRKLKHPQYIELKNGAVEDLEPDFSSVKGDPALECPNFPLLRRHMQRIGQLRQGLHSQTSRTKRINFLKKVLQDSAGIPTGEFEDVSDDENDTRSAIPPALALLMNATKFFHDAPGINRRRKQSKSKDENKEDTRLRSFSVHPGTSQEVERARDKMFTNRRNSVAPSTAQ